MSSIDEITKVGSQQSSKSAKKNRNRHYKNTPFPVRTKIKRRESQSEENVPLTPIKTKKSGATPELNDSEYCFLGGPGSLVQDLNEISEFLRVFQTLILIPLTVSSS